MVQKPIISTGKEKRSGDVQNAVYKVEQSTRGAGNVSSSKTTMQSTSKVLGMWYVKGLAIKERRNNLV